jgi:hypothetical protein
MSHIVEPDDGTRRLDRRDVLKKAGIIGVGMWTAPAVTSLTSPAFAQGSGQPGSSLCPIILAEDSTVSVQLTTYIACNTLEFGLEEPRQERICQPCSTSTSASLGSFSAGTGLVFYLNDPADCCGCPQRYTCDDGTNAEVIRVDEFTYRVRYRDNGCSCGSSNISEGANLEALVTISPTGG